MHAFPTYVSAAAILIAATTRIRVTPVASAHESEPRVYRMSIDLSPVQDAWAWLRGRGARAVRREMAGTAYYLERVRGVAEEVLAGSMSRADAHDALMFSRYPSISTRWACAEQLDACVNARVARVWVDDEWPSRLAEHHAAHGRTT